MFEVYYQLLDMVVLYKILESELGKMMRDDEFESSRFIIENLEGVLGDD